MTEIYEIRDKILAGSRLVLGMDQLSNIIPVPRDQARIYAGRLVKRGFAKRIVEGVISLTEDPFVIATQLIEPSYVSFTAALYLRGVIQQIPMIVECVTTKNTFKLKSPRIEYHKTDPYLFFGYKRIERYGSYVFVAELEKAILDMVYFGLHPETMKFELDMTELRSFSKAYEAVKGFRSKRVLRWVEKNAE